MSKDQTEAGPDRGKASKPRRSGLARLRAQPGFRTAVIAFVLTVVLGVGGTAAFAYWSQSAAVTITGSTRSDLPANTTLIGAQPVLAARPGTPSGQVCSPLLSDEQMRPNNYADIRFSWTGAAGATQYVVTVKGKNGSFAYDQTQSVSGAAAEFRFGRLPSDQYGKPVGDSSPFYTSYTVRVLPMAGAVPGDPLYFTYKYEHYNGSNCFWSEPTGASPVGSAGTVQCAPLSGTGAGGYSDLGVSWARADKATSYSVRFLNAAGYGAETTVSTTSTTFRVPRLSDERENEPYFGQYIVRVQPMNGNAAGDPVYKTYQFGKRSQECW